MRKQSKRKPRPTYYPMLVIDHVCGKELEIANWNCLNAFMRGVADESHFKHFNDMANVLLIAGTIKQKAALLAEFIEGDVLPVLMSIKTRYEQCGKFGLAGGDVDILRDFINVYIEYWRWESSNFLVQCQTEMQAYYASLHMPYELFPHIRQTVWGQPQAKTPTGLLGANHG